MFLYPLLKREVSSLDYVYVMIQDQKNVGGTFWLVVGCLPS